MTGRFHGSMPPWLIAVFICAVTTSCAHPGRLSAVPVSVQEEAVIPDMPDVRFWGDGAPDALVHETIAALHREQRTLQAAGHRGPLPPAMLLALSGGGENGAFGAGLLVGWTAAGTRPTFKAVTGISTGALIALFAFLGPAYDLQLKSVYTEITSENILERRSFWAAFFDDAIADNKPLRVLVEEFVTPELLTVVASEYQKGRLLLVGTTNLDAQRPVIWNMGKIAASGHPGALKLFQNILIASAALPAIFPPMMIDVEVNGRHYQEMHVDGGAMTQVFAYPPSVDLSDDIKKTFDRERHFYIIRNARLDPDWVEVERQTLSIAARTILSLTQTQGIGDLYRIYVQSQRDDIDFNAAYIPDTFVTTLEEPFDQKYMRELFDVGYTLATQGGDFWHKAPPGYAISEPTAKALPR